MDKKCPWLGRARVTDCHPLAGDLGLWRLRGARDDQSATRGEKGGSKPSDLLELPGTAAHDEVEPSLQLRPPVGQVFGSEWDDLGVLKLESADGGAERRRSPAASLEEREPDHRPDYPQRDSGNPGARAEVEHRAGSGGEKADKQE